MNHLAFVAMATVVALGFGATSADAQRRGQATSITVGKVVSASEVRIKSDAGKGAILGGIIGAVTQSGRSGSKKAKYGLIGAAGGAALGSTTGGQGMQYVVETAPGQAMTVVTDQREIRVGDCVTVEQASNGYANVRRTSQAACRGPVDDLGPEIRQEMQSDADECAIAKERLIDAETDAEIDSWIRRVQVLCDN